MKDYTIIPPTKDELTPKGFTNKIKLKEGVTVESLLDYGFTNYNKPTLYLMRMVGKNISFNLGIDKATLEITSIDVLDEDFLQPYDYQSILMKNNNNSFACGIFNAVDKILSGMKDVGIITGYQRGMYI